jgi:hypothetical protein
MTSWPFPVISNRVTLAGTWAVCFLTASVVVVSIHAVVPIGHRETALGGRENPEARMLQEWLMLRDPVAGTVPKDMRARELAFAKRLPNPETDPRYYKRDATAGFGWSARGPFNIGGRTRAFAVDVTNPDVLLAGAVSGGMWRSTDRGVTWRKTTDPTQLHSVTCVTQDTRPGHTNTWYYGTGELIGNSARGEAANAMYRGNGLFKSTNGGQSWQQLLSTASNTPGVYDNVFDYVFGLAIDPSNDSEDEIYAATIAAIVRSTDGGASWTAVRGGFSSGESRYTDVAVTHDGVVYATMSDLTVGMQSGASSRGLWRSTDGIHWTNIAPAGFPSRFNRIVIGLSSSVQETVHFLGETPGAGYQTSYGGSPEDHSFWTYRYLGGDGTGAGGSWSDASGGLPAFGQPVGNFVSQGSYDLVIRVKPDNPSCIFIGGTNLYRSTNGGTTWDWVGGYSSANDVSTAANHHPDQHGLVFSPDDARVLYSTHDGGVSVTSDCLAAPLTWRSLNHGYQTTQFYSVAIDPGTAGSPVIIGGTQDNGSPLTVASDPAVPWNDYMGGDGGYCYVTGGAAYLLTSYQSGEVYRLRQSDSKYVRIDPVGGSGYLFITPFAVDPNVETILYMAVGSKVWRNSSLDDIPFDMTQNPHAQGWLSLDGSSLGGAYVSALAVSREPANRLYYGSSDGRLFRFDDANVAQGSAVPTDIWTGKGFPVGGYVSCIAIDPQNADRLLVTFSNYNVESVFSSTDGGMRWESVEGNLAGVDGPSIRWALIAPTSGPTSYLLATSTGVYSTSGLAGSSTVWIQEGGSAIGNVVVDMLAYRMIDARVVAATHGQGMFSSTLSGGMTPPSTVPVMNVLGQNYPNPFNASTTIPITIAQAGRTTIQIYSLTGQLVTTLLDADLPAGERRVGWSPRSLASGVYLCTMATGGDLVTRPILYLK